MLDVPAANPHADPADIMAAVDKATEKRERHLVTISQHLPNMILGSSLGEIYLKR